MQSSSTSHLSMACCLQLLALGPGWLLEAGAILQPVALLGVSKVGAWMLLSSGECLKGFSVLLNPQGSPQGKMVHSQHAHIFGAGGKRELI